MSDKKYYVKSPKPSDLTFQPAEKHPKLALQRLQRVERSDLDKTGLPRLSSARLYLPDDDYPKFPSASLRSRIEDRGSKIEGFQPCAEISFV